MRSWRCIEKKKMFDDSLEWFDVARYVLSVLFFYDVSLANSFMLGVQGLPEPRLRGS